MGGILEVAAGNGKNLPNGLSTREASAEVGQLLPVVAPVPPCPCGDGERPRPSSSPHGHERP